jgi:flagellar hook assembly protein FlgD
MGSEDFQLYQSYPNPFNSETIIKYDLLKSCEVNLTIYNILGQKVKTLANERQEAGSKTIGWDGKDEKGKDLASGIYFYQLKAGEVTQTKRMVLLK